VAATTHRWQQDVTAQRARGREWHVLDQVLVFLCGSSLQSSSCGSHNTTHAAHSRYNYTWRDTHCTPDADCRITSCDLDAGSFCTQTSTNTITNEHQHHHNTTTDPSTTRATATTTPATTHTPQYSTAHDDSR
jgi:hypothetical protein